MSVKDISIDDYDYPLPEQRIALHPLEERDACRLLVARQGGGMSDARFSDLPALLPKGALLVYNDTRVINARIRMRKPTGAQIEIFLLEPKAPADYERAFAARGEARWSALVGNVKKWKEGELEKSATLPDGTALTLRATLGGTLPGGEREVMLTWTPADTPFATVVEAMGHIPIPPYLNRESEASDTDDYQTVYSRAEGSVAAPTAGLHFTPALLERLAEAGVERAPLTLHVGAGTFKPVKADHIGDHPMHTEVFTVSRATLEALIRAKEEGRPIVAVGTTSVRTLESLPLLGLSGGTDRLHLGQWDAYADEDTDTVKRLKSLLDLMDAAGTDSLTASTAIMIAPGFRWRMVDAMITNFHQPRSTLLLLVSSFLGRHGLDWRDVYRHALAGDYRFLSYGDACLFGL